MKKIVSLVLIVISLLVFTVPAYAATETVIIEPETYAKENAVARAELTEWYYRTNPTTGAAEKRQWSVTYMYWKTDWIPA